MKLKVFRQRVPSPVDKAATSTWADQAWFKKSVEQMKPIRSDVCVADGREIQVAGIGVLDLRVWGVTVHEEVRVMSVDVGTGH